MRFRADMDTDCLKVYCAPCHEIPAVPHKCPNSDSLPSDDLDGAS